MPFTAIASFSVRILYAGYAWFMLIFVVIPVAVCCLLLPGEDRRRAVARRGAATMLRLIGSGVTVRGTALGEDDSAVVVANHQSYLDGIILAAVLPPHYTFLIKREMVRVPIAGFVLRRIGSQFVDRSSANHRHRSARRLVESAREGQALAVFPEGTFDREPGLKPFRMGAFRAAMLGKLSIVPVVITGSRTKLPADSWLPRPGPLTVEFCPRIATADFEDELSLARETRRAILERLGEPDLDTALPKQPEPSAAEARS
ncbi:MAG TPA: lysophospholipid acyltransferase family protein [Gammaproteobacteria bacterium]